MGVKNLWRLLLPVGHRLSIETLSHQTLAIDASIWLTQVSKACRDPETGRLLPNKPHVRIFLLRLMRLLYHQIKPVVVFDGVMPEVKRREIQRRKERRERLWRDDDDDNRDGSGGGGALRRTAKKILVKQLKEFREREKESKLKKKGTPSLSKTEADAEGGAAASQPSNNGGAFAAGFTIDEDEADGDTTKQSSDFDIVQSDATKLKSVESNDDDVISTNSHDSREQAKQQLKSQLGQFKSEHAKDQVDGDQYESDNDWEMSHAVQSSINESIQQQTSNGHHGTSYYKPSNDNPFDNEFYQKADNETIAALPTEARSQWVDSQKAARRIQSRQECIEAAANPEDYSSAQLRNFLKGSKLNKRVGEIDKLVEKRRDEDQTPLGVAADGGGPEHTIAMRNAQRRPLLHRVGRRRDSDDENEIFNSTDAQQRGASMKVLFGDDDSDDENDDNDGGGGGFLLPSSGADGIAQSGKSKKNDVVLLDDESRDNNSGSQGNDDASTISNGSNLDKSAIIDDSLERKQISSDNDAPTTTAKDTTTTMASSQRSKMLELSTAGQEWEQWGHEGSDDASEVKVESCKQVETVDMSKNETATDASESESDDDGDFGGSFLMLGQISKTASSVPAQALVGNTLKGRVNKSEQNDDDNSCRVDDDDDEVNWEDGDSGTGQDNGDVDWEDRDSCSDIAESAIGDTNIKDQETIIDAIREESDNFAMKEKRNKDLSKTEAKVLKGIKRPGQVPSKDGERNVVELPSEDDKSLQFADDAADVDKDENPLMADHDNQSLEENEFDSFHPDNQTTVALQHAQQTASRLTSWAGRAFQRAMAAHVGQQPGSPSKKESPRKEEIDLTMDEDVIAVDEVDNSEHSISEGVLDIDTAAKDDSPDQPRPHRRLDLFDTSLEGLNEAHNAIIEEEKAMERDMDTITDEMKDDILKLLVLCGVPWIESPSEAEAQCAALEELGLVDGVVTEDSDIFVFGGRKVYKNFFNEQKYVEAYFAKDIERDLALKKHQLVALAMLLGGDYTDGVKGVGIVNGMELLQAWPISDSADGIKDGLQAFKTWLDSFDEPSENINDRTTSSKQWLFHKKHKSARTRWVAPANFPSQAIINAYLKPAVDKSEAKFSWAPPNLDGLQQFCAETLGWEKEETDNVVNPVLSVLQKGSRQTRLESYFMRYEDNVTFAQVKSKRLKAVLRDIQGGIDAKNEAALGRDGNGKNIEPHEMDSEVQPKSKKQRTKK